MSTSTVMILFAAWVFIYLLTLWREWRSRVPAEHRTLRQDWLATGALGGHAASGDDGIGVLPSVIAGRPYGKDAFFRLRGQSSGQDRLEAQVSRGPSCPGPA